MPALVRLWAWARSPACSSPAASRLGAADRGLGGPQPALGALFSDQDLVYQRLFRLCGRSALSVRVISPRAQAAVVARRMDHAVGEAGCLPVRLGAWRLGGLWVGGRTGRVAPHAAATAAGGGPQPGASAGAAVTLATAAVPILVIRLLGTRRTAQLAAAGRKARPPSIQVSSAYFALLSPQSLSSLGFCVPCVTCCPPAAPTPRPRSRSTATPDVRAADATGLVLAQKAAALHRQRFAAEEPPEMKAQISRVLAEFHAKLPRQLAHFETLTWLSLVPTAHAPPPGSAADAQAFAARLATSLRRGREQPELARSFGVLRRACFSRCRVCGGCRARAASTCGPRPHDGVPGVRVPAGLDRKLLDEDGDAQPTPRPPLPACGKSAMSWSASARKQAPGLRTTAGPAARRAG